MQGAPRHPRRPCDEGLTAVAKRFGFGGSPQATGPFVHHWRQGNKFFSNDRFHNCLFHRSIIGHFTKVYELFMDEPLVLYCAVCRLYPMYAAPGSHGGQVY